jgi:hypothetical protein
MIWKCDVNPDSCAISVATDAVAPDVSIIIFGSVAMDVL